MSSNDTIRVYLYGEFRKLAPDTSPFGESFIDVPCREGEKIETIISRLGIKRDEVSHIFLNGEYSSAQRHGQAGDRLGLFPKNMSLLYRQYFPVKGGD
ncbi:hypothetical protein SY88_22050 [Clostridiales bacterium PH28_bin88]|nr:hypothetical protein SY88_22050 [Clostridiales bacterium PH28_bin88]